MDNSSDFASREERKRFTKLGDRLAEVDALIDWDVFRPIVAGMCDNTSGMGGRHNIDVVVMIKMLVLHAWHGLSDPELERQVTDGISFRRFLGFPDFVRDSATVWLFRGRASACHHSCPRDHQVYEACRLSTPTELIRRTFKATRERDPVALARELLDMRYGLGERRAPGAPGRFRWSRGGAGAVIHSLWGQP
jgi:hypothetical protein